MPDCDCPGTDPCTSDMNSASCCFARCQCASPCYCDDAKGRDRANLCILKCAAEDSAKKMPNDVELHKSLTEVTLRNEAKLDDLEKRLKKVEANKVPKKN